MNHFLFMGPREWIFIALIVVLLFGAKKIPELMKGIGSGIKEFKDATKEQDAPSKDDKKDV